MGGVAGFINIFFEPLLIVSKARFGTGFKTGFGEELVGVWTAMTLEFDLMVPEVLLPASTLLARSDAEDSSGTFFTF